MADETKLLKAKKVFCDLCAALDDQDLRYEKDEEALEVSLIGRGEDLPIKLDITVRADRMKLDVISSMPVTFSEEKRLDGAIAASVINNCLVDGSFDYDVKTGDMYFRMTNSFIDSEPGAELFMYLVRCSFSTIDDYNDKLLMLAKGIISLEKFIEMISAN